MFKFKNEILVRFGETDNTLPSADTIMETGERDPETVTGPILKILRKIKKR